MIPFSLSSEPTLYKNQTFIPLRVVSEFLDCRIAWDNPSKSVFIKSSNDFYEAENLFHQSANALKKCSSVKMDIISEITYPEGNFSFGHSVYVDKNANTIYTKNMLDSDWKLSAIRPQVKATQLEIGASNVIPTAVESTM